MAEKEDRLKIKVKKHGKDGIEVTIEGARHTLPNILRNELWNDSSVTFAAYEKPHPLVGNPRLVVRGKDPKKSLIEAIKRVEENFKRFEKDFAKAAGAK